MLLPVLRYLSIPLLKLLLADIAAFFAFYYLEPGRRTGEPAPGSGKRLKIALALLFCFTAYFFAAGPAWKALFENQWEDVIRDRYTEKRARPAAGAPDRRGRSAGQRPERLLSHHR